MVSVQPGAVRDQVRRHALARQRHRVPVRGCLSCRSDPRRTPSTGRIALAGSLSSSSHTPQAWLSHSSTSVLMKTRKKPVMSGSRTSRSMASWTASLWMRAMHSARRRSLISRASASAQTSRDARASRCADRLGGRGILAGLADVVASLPRPVVATPRPPPDTCHYRSATGSTRSRHAAEARPQPKVADPIPPRSRRPALTRWRRGRRSHHHPIVEAALARDASEPCTTRLPRAQRWIDTRHAHDQRAHRPHGPVPPDRSASG